MGLFEEKNNIQKALEELEILEIELSKINEEYLKKKFHKLALKWHPDKNNSENAKIKFQKICESYNYLLNCIQYENENNKEKFQPFVSSNESTIYIDLLTNFIFSLVKGSYNELLLGIIQELSSEYEYLRQKFEILDKEKAIELYQLLYKYKDILYINNETLEIISLIITEKYKNNRIFILKPCLKDIIEHNIYKLYVNDNLYLVPLWHNELYFDAPDGSDIIVLCQPKLPTNITIDENNNIYYEKNIEIETEFKNLIKSNFVSIEIGEKWFSIPLNNLYIKNEQLYKFKNQGIAHILEKDIYNVSSKANIIVKIILY